MVSQGLEGLTQLIRVALLVLPGLLEVILQELNRVCLGTLVLFEPLDDGFEQRPQQLGAH